MNIELAGNRVILLCVFKIKFVSLLNFRTMQQFKFSLLLLIGLSFSFSGCFSDKCDSTFTYTKYNPVYISYDELIRSVASEKPRSLNNTGKIYLKDQYIFVNEIDKGVHVIDNSDPTNPVTVSFINIPGNLDIAIKDQVLYADSYIDFVAINISDILNVKELSREKDVFPQRIYSTGYYSNPDSGFVIEWVPEVITEKINCSGPVTYYEMDGLAFNNSGAVVGISGTPSSSTSAGPGTGGSMARFAIVGDYIYVIDNQDLHLFNIQVSGQPTYANKVPVGFNIETLFPYQNYLFIGATNGMYIFDNSNPKSPSKITQFAHVNSCDPVVVQGNTAYVTLRSGNDCNGFTNQLDVIDISNINSPALIKSYDMSNPFGLGIDDKMLFICDNTAGLKVFDVTDVMAVDQNLLDRVESITPFDIIPIPALQRAIVIGKDGLYQYDYSNPNDLKFLSAIPVGIP
jgi:hypothetical protein